jgi:hypothetical protein
VGRDFPYLSRPAPRPTQPPVQWVKGLSRGRMRPGRDADHTPPSSAEVKKELSYNSTYPMGPPGPVTGFTFYNSYQKDKRANSGNLRTYHCCFSDGRAEIN